MTTYIDYLKLVETAREAAKNYYDTDVEIMTDAEYDDLIEQIEILSAENGWTEGEELLEQVAGGVSEGGDVKHVIPMLSLSKSSSQVALTSFIESVDGPIVLEPKLDGLAISAIYRDGELVQIATRGDGQTGEDITNRARGHIKGLPTSIAHKGDFEVRGEVFITSTDFVIASKNRIEYNYNEWKRRNSEAKTATIDSIYAAAGANKLLPEGAKRAILKGAKSDFIPEKFLFANSRNAVAGSLRSERKYEVPMTFAAYDVYAPILDAEPSYRKRIEFVVALGINAANDLLPASIRVTTDTLSAINEFGELRTAGLEFPTDGIVLKADSISDRKRLGSGSKSPKWATAYKYPSISSRTRVLGIETMIGRTGRLSLRAKLVPVIVDGTRIEYVSLHNVGWTEEKDIRIGDTVEVRRANDVIPYIDNFVPALRPEKAVRWTPPAVCPQCGEEWDKSTLLWRCTSPSCGELNSVIFAAGREYFDWEGFSEAIITRLNDDGLVTSIADVFNLTEDQLKNLVMAKKGENDDFLTKKDGSLEILGEKTAAKIFEQIQKSKKRPLSAVLAALGIRTLGRTFGRRMAGHFGSMSAILKASVEDFTNVEGIAIKKAEIIHAGLREKRDIIVRLKDAGVTMVAEQPKVTANGGYFTGKKIVVTGSVPGYTRSSIQEFLTSIGAVASSSVSSNTDFLVADADSEGSSKYKKASSLGVKILSPEEFLKLAA